VPVKGGSDSECDLCSSCMICAHPAWFSEKKKNTTLPLFLFQKRHHLLIQQYSLKSPVVCCLQGSLRSMVSKKHLPIFTFSCFASQIRDLGFNSDNFSASSKVKGRRESLVVVGHLAQIHWWSESQFHLHC
jgi:hypothetical protein